jgi:hypothetical protein
MSLKNLCLAASAALAVSAGSANAQVVISQVYGGGGNTGAPFTNDFVELFNKGNAPVDITGWSVQYASATGSTWGVTALTGTIPAGGYYLVQLAGGANGVALPTPDATGTSNMSGTNGKVALSSTATQLTGTCPTGLVDFVGFGGTANCFEGAGATAVLSNSTAAIRQSGGCTDTNVNSADFFTGTPTPRNSASPTNVCTSSTPPSGVGAATPSTACLAANVVMTVTVTPGASPTSTGITVTGDTTSIGGGPGVAFLDDGIAPDAAAGDSIFTAQAAANAFFFGNQTVPVAITDAQARTGNASVVFTVVDCNPSISFTGSAAVCETYPQLLVVAVNPAQGPASTGIVVTADLSSIGAGTVALLDNGTNGDPVANDGFYGAMFTVPSGSATNLVFPINFSDAESRTASGSASITNIGACTDATSSVVISQIYGGGGNTGATYTHDFVELFNRGSTPVDISGWSLQRLSANGTELTFSAAAANFHQITSGVIQPGQYFLVQQAQGAGGTTALPTPDAIGAMTMSSSDGMMFLANSGTLLASFTDPAIMDRVGFGLNGVNPLASFEGHGAMKSLGNTVAGFRHKGGCQDTNNNDVDFYRANPAPRNSASPLNDCSPGCPADLDNDGTFPGGTSDGGVDINDLLYFLAGFEAGSPAVDLDNDGDPAVGTPDGGTDINDLLFFLARFEGGC